MTNPWYDYVVGELADDGSYRGSLEKPFDGFDADRAAMIALVVELRLIRDELREILRDTPAP